MNYQTLLVEPRGEHILLVTLNRPDVLNALNTQMGMDQTDLWTRLTAEPGNTRCVVLTGAGDRAFCAGADLKERDGMTETVWRAQHEIFERAFMALMECPVPVIAAVNGHAFGGGLEMALCCDFIYAARGARMALPEVRLGLMPGGAGTQNLPRAAGERRDGRQRKLHQRHEAALEELVLRLPVGLRHAVALLEVRAGAERALARAREHDAARLARLGGKPRPELVQLAPHLRVERVQRLRAIQGDERYLIAGLDGKGLVAHRGHCVATIRRAITTRTAARGDLSNPQRRLAGSRR